VQRVSRRRIGRLKEMTLTQSSSKRKPHVSSVRSPPECYDLEQAGYAKTTALNLQDTRVEITLAGRVALQRVARKARGEQWRVV
jgi:hypothetical protein